MLHHILNFFFTTINNKPCGSIDPSALCLNWEALSMVGIQDLGFSHFIILIQHQRINNLHCNSAVESVKLSFLILTSMPSHHCPLRHNSGSNILICDWTYRRDSVKKFAGSCFPRSIMMNLHWIAEDHYRQQKASLINPNCV